MSVLGFNAALEKQPWEQITVKANFNDVASSLVVSGYALNNCTVAVKDRAGANQDNNMIEGSPTLDANNQCIFVCFKGGNDGQNYYAQFQTYWAKNSQPDQKIERDLLIQVQEKGF
jgi:hypothetical protein